MSNSISVVANYQGSEQTRTYTFSDVPQEVMVPATIQSKIQAINASLAGGTADSLASFFVADDFDGTNGKLSKLTNAKLTRVIETEIKET